MDQIDNIIDNPFFGVWLGLFTLFILFILIRYMYKGDFSEGGVLKIDHAQQIKEEMKLQEILVNLKNRDAIQKAKPKNHKERMKRYHETK